MCINTMTLEEEAEEACDGITKPLTQQECNTEPCLEWSTGVWSEVSLNECVMTTGWDENSISVLQHSTQNITVYHIVSRLFTLEVPVIKEV